MPIAPFWFRIRRMEAMRRTVQVGFCSAAALGIILLARPVRAAGMPATRPATASAPAADPPNISQAAIDLTDREKIALSVVRDGPQPDEAALRMMLARAKSFADDRASAEAEFASLESPAFGHLSDYPRRYRAQKVRLTVEAMICRKVVSGAPDWSAQPDWPKGNVVWRIEGYALSRDRKKREPMIVFSVVDPTRMLGEPMRIDSNGWGVHGNVSRRGPILQLSAISYKTVRLQERDSGPGVPIWRDYPVVLAYYLARSEKPPAAPMARFLTMLVLLLAALVFGFIMLKRRVGRIRNLQAARIGRGGYQSLRHTEVDEMKQAPRERDDAGAATVDPALVEAVKEFETERRQVDGTDSQD